MKCTHSCTPPGLFCTLYEPPDCKFKAEKLFARCSCLASCVCSLCSYIKWSLKCFKGLMRQMLHMCHTVLTERLEPLSIDIEVVKTLGESDLEICINLFLVVAWEGERERNVAEEMGGRRARWEGELPFKHLKPGDECGWQPLMVSFL